jgi:hypothetical protein
MDPGAITRNLQKRPPLRAVVLFLFADFDKLLSTMAGFCSIS